jgi:prepilin peptidase CpaA
VRLISRLGFHAARATYHSPLKGNDLFVGKTKSKIMLNTLLLFIFPLGMAYAASSDLLTMRISNWVSISLIVSFFVIAVFMGMSFEQIAWHLGAAATILVAAFLFFALGWVGGGDAKLATATGLWLGFELTLPYLLYASILGGVLTLGLLAFRRLPLPPRMMSTGWISRLHDQKSGIPYGIALAAAGMLVYAETPIFQYFSS